MKNPLIAFGVMFVVCGAFAQGTINNSNFNPGQGVDARLFETVGTTGLAGEAFLSNLYVWDTTVGWIRPAGLSPVGPASSFYPTGSGGEGYWNPTSNGGLENRAVDGLPAGTEVFYQVHVWEVARPAIVAWSNVGSTTLGGGIILPGALFGLQSFSNFVPEPSTIILGLLGAVALVYFRRRKW